MDMLAAIDPVILACSLAAFGVVWLVWKTLVERSTVNARLKAVTERRDELAAAAKPAHGGHAQRKRLISVGVMKQVVNALQMGSAERLQSTRLKLVQAGYRGRDAVIIFIFTKIMLLCAGLVLPILVASALGLDRMKPGILLISIAFGASIGWALPDIILKNQKQKREQQLRKGMPDALDLLVICAEAGLSLDASFERVSREMAQGNALVAEEFGLTGVELNLLPDRTRALQGMAERVDMPGVTALVNTLIQTEKFGTPLAQALRVLSAELREERMMRAEEKAARLPATLTVPMMLFILPTLFIVLVGPAAIKVKETMGKAKHSESSKPSNSANKHQK